MVANERLTELRGVTKLLLAKLRNFLNLPAFQCLNGKAPFEMAFILGEIQLILLNDV